MRTATPSNHEPEIILSVRDVSVSFGDKQILDRLSLDVRRGEILGFVGASGSGTIMPCAFISPKVSSAPSPISSAADARRFFK